MFWDVPRLTEVCKAENHETANYTAAIRKQTTGEWRLLFRNVRASVSEMNGENWCGRNFSIIQKVSNDTDNHLFRTV